MFDRHEFYQPPCQCTCKRFGNFLVKIKAILSKSKTYLQLRKFKDLLQAYMASSPVVFLPQEFQLAIKGDTSSHNMVWRGFYNMSWIWIRNSSQSLVSTPNNLHGFSLHDFSPAKKKIVGKLRKKGGGRKGVGKPQNRTEIRQKRQTHRIFFRIPKPHISGGPL